MAYIYDTYGNILIIWMRRRPPETRFLLQKMKVKPLKSLGRAQNHTPLSEKPRNQEFAPTHCHPMVLKGPARNVIDIGRSARSKSRRSPSARQVQSLGLPLLHRAIGRRRGAALRIASAVAVAGFAGQAFADSSPPSSAGPAASPGPFGFLDLKGPNLFGGLWGLRPALSAYGVTLAILENVETFGNLSGGVKQGFEANGLTTVTVQMDTGKAFGLRGGTLNASGLEVWGGNLSADNLMVVQTATDIEAPVGIRLWELWYQQKFGDTFDLKIGEQSLDEEFIIAPSGNSLFINAVSGWPALPSANLPGGGPVYPLAGLGVRARAQLTDRVTVLGGVFNGSPIPRDSPDAATSNPHGVSFPLDV